MPQILGKDNSKWEQTIASQAETEYYKQLTKSLASKLQVLYRSDYKRDSEAEKIINPSQEDIDATMYEFSNDMLPNELMIIIKVGINNAHRLLTDKEIYQIAKMYEAYKKYGTREYPNVPIMTFDIKYITRRKF